MSDADWYTPSLVPPPGGPTVRRASAITTHGLVRRFGAMTAIDGVDIDVREGEIYGFLGPNGAGKSSLVRVLCTLLSPSEGTATVAGYDVADHPEEVRIRIGAALQEAALDDRQTGRELLVLQGRLYGLRSAAIRSPPRRGARPGRHRRRHRPSDRDVLGRDEAAAGSGRAAHPQPAGPVPRRTHHGPGPGQPVERLGRGASGSIRSSA